jgi:CheY-like chemotaxis protein
MGGSIQVRSQLGEGTCFTVEIAFEIAQNYQEQNPVHKKAELTGMKILLVEDNELNTEIAKEILEDEGILVTVAENGKQAYEAFTLAPPGRFDVILMDVMMPVMNGYEATKAIRESNHPEAKTIPIIAMTANAYKEDVDKALDAGMNAHVAKPIDIQMLMSVLDNYRRKGDT